MEPIAKFESSWKGKLYIEEFYQTSDFSKLPSISQVQAVTFINPSAVVLYKNVAGYYGFPGGKVEAGENPEAALRREVDEEMAAEIVSLKQLGFLKTWEKEKPGNVTYNARYVAAVKLMDKPISDPCKKAVGREIVPVDQAEKMLGWGEKGKVLIEIARSMLSYIYEN